MVTLVLVLLVPLAIVAGAVGGLGVLFFFVRWARARKVYATAQIIGDEKSEKSDGQSD